MKSQRPVVFLVSGPVTVNGVLNFSGSDGSASQQQYENRTPTEWVDPGGVGAPPNYPTAGIGAGPGGANINSGASGCDGSYTYTGAGASGCKPGSTYGDQEVLPLVGGSGGSGGASTSATYTGASGGGGGGAIRICSDVSISVGPNASGAGIYANGGNGGRGASGGGNGGAGSGGSIHLQAPSVTIKTFSSLNAIGGYDYSTITNSGSVGRIGIDTNSLKRAR